MGKQDFIRTEGDVVEAMGYENFRVELENGVTILASPSGKMRLHHIRVMAGDHVKVELSPYDLTRGRIIQRCKVVHSHNVSNND